MRKIFFTIIIFLLGSVLFFVYAQADEELVVDPECAVYIASSGDDIYNRICNNVCKKSCIEQEINCAYGNPYECRDYQNLLDNKDTTAIRKGFNIFGVQLCPDPSSVPPGDPYCTLNLVRLGFYFVISLIVFATVIIGLWVVWQRSTAGDNTDKIENAAKTARNALLGILIAFLFIVIVQVAALLLGVTGSLFEFSIVPQITPTP